MQTNTPLRFSLLWHQHQPDYRTSTGFRLPWVRLHATKDYADLPLLLCEYKVVHTMNIVPTLIEQLQDYSPTYTDELERVSRVPSHVLNILQKEYLISMFQTAHRTTMVERFPRFTELYDDVHSNNWQGWLPKDWCDAIVLFHLMWMGYKSMQRQKISTLIQQGRAFTETQKIELLDEIHEILNSVLDVLKGAMLSGTLELSTTPMHHPILPLVIDTNVARESMSDTELPYPAFSASEDARWHIREAEKIFTSTFGSTAVGMWPAEGAVSTAALELFAEHGVQWVATDELVLKNTLGTKSLPTSHFAPHRFSSPKGDISILFRDHELSDAIGFEYTTWAAETAADDFIRRLEERRRRIIEEHGVDALQHMVVPIILDGENCWEYYPNNGEDFLRVLLQKLQDTPTLTSVYCSEASQPEHCIFPVLTSIQAGSWIAGNFAIWIGNNAKNNAWQLLHHARTRMIATGIDMWHAIYKAEASDWFWWYEERHNAQHAYTFDVAFRELLSEIYSACRAEPPQELLLPLHTTTQMNYKPLLFGAQAMHRANTLTKGVTTEHYNGWQRITIEFERWPDADESCVLTLKTHDSPERSAMVLQHSHMFTSELHDEGFETKNMSAIFYVHENIGWTLTVTEEYAQGGTATTSLKF